MVENVSRVKLRKISVMKLSYVFAFFGLVLGLLNGFPFFVAVRALIEGWGMANVSSMGLGVLSFGVFPLVMAILLWIAGMISGLIINLSLRLFRGLDMLYEELD